LFITTASKRPRFSGRKTIGSPLDTASNAPVLRPRISIALKQQTTDSGCVGTRP
jgi:hypothetical protein